MSECLKIRNLRLFPSQSVPNASLQCLTAVQHTQRLLLVAPTPGKQAQLLHPSYLHIPMAVAKDSREISYYSAVLFSSKKSAEQNKTNPKL